MDLTTFFGSILGAGGVVGFIQFMISRHDNKNEQLNRIEKKVDLSLEKGDRNELATTRLQLFFLMETQPENKDTIMRTAERYFTELDGNGEAWDAFQHWADQHNVNTSWYLNLVEREKRRQKN